MRVSSFYDCSSTGLQIRYKMGSLSLKLQIIRKTREPSSFCPKLPEQLTFCSVDYSL